MRITMTRTTARLRRTTIGALVVLMAGVGATGTVSGSTGGPTAVVSKKGKCKGPLWKCAPKRYHLSATDTVGPGSQSSGFQENWSAEVDLVRIRRSIGTVVYGSAGGTVRVSGSFATVCTDGSPATVRIEPQTIAVPTGPGYPFLGAFGVEFSLIGSGKNTYGGPLGSEGSGHSSLFVTAIDPCPDGAGTFQTELAAGRIGMEGRGKVGKVLRGSDVFNTIFQHHSFSWTLSPRK